MNKGWNDYKDFCRKNKLKECNFESLNKFMLMAYTYLNKNL